MLNYCLSLDLLLIGQIKYTRSILIEGKGMADKKEFHIEINEEIPAGLKAVSILSERTDLSQQHIKAAMKKGALWIEDDKGIRRLRRADTIPPMGSVLHFYYSPNVLEEIPPAPHLIADIREYSIWFKPPEMLSQGSKWGDHCTINRWIETNMPFDHHPQRNCFVVHRLDRAARGLMMIAHKKNVAAKLSGLFESREIDKRYHVVVEGEFPEGEQEIKTQIEGKFAHSIARSIEYSEKKNRSLVEVQIKTGRKHQIRIHMSGMGFPVVGDLLHGNINDKDSTQEELQLCAFSLKYTCPVRKEQQKFELPDKFCLQL